MTTKTVQKSQQKMAKLLSKVGFVLLCASPAFAGPGEDPLFIPQTVTIARKQIVNPATDLQEANGNILDSDDVLAKMQSGMDVSLLNPAPTDVWPENPSQQPIVYPSENSDGYVNFRFDSLVTSPRGLARSRVVTDDAAARPYRMTMSWNMHSALMNAELLRQVGYTIDLPRRYAKARLRFADIASRDLFLREVSGGTGSLIEQWLIKEPAADDLVIELRDFAVEPARIATPPYYWGAISRNEMQNRRVIRALLIPLVLTSIPDSINLWTWQVGNLVNERILLYHPFAGNFQGQLNFDDARWIARRVCAIQEPGLRQIIKAGGYPESIEPLLYEKLKSRINDMMALSQVSCRPLPVNPHLTYNDPETGKLLVENGKLLRKEFPGYGFKFIGEDPLSPLRKDELFRYMKLRGLGLALSAGLEELNSKLLSFDQSDAQYFRNDQWAFKSGPREKVSLSATRKLVSGTYFGSESQVQLVDQVSVSAAVGYFASFKNRAIKNVDFSVEPNVAVSRSYMHVKPMASIEEAMKTPWKDLPVIPKMRALAKLLDAEKETEQDIALNAFLEKFLPGENFTIVDSIDMGARIGASLPLPPFQVLPNEGKLSFSSGYDHLVLRRSMIQRQADGLIQVTLQRVKKDTTDFSLSYNFVVDIVSGVSTRSGNDADAVVYVLDPETTTDKKQLNEALKALLISNDSSLLEKDFKAYELSHDLFARTKKLKFLPFTFANYKEAHILEAYAPGSAKTDALKRELFSIRERSLSGSDWLGFGTKTASTIGQKLLIPNAQFDLSDQSGLIDPSGSFLGRSHFHEVQLEAELTPSRNSKTLMTIQETYKGWTLSQARMLRIMRRLEAKAHEISDSSPSLFHFEEFLSTTRLLLFQITSSLRVSGPGLDALVTVAKASANETVFRSQLARSGRIDISSQEGLNWLGKAYRLFKAVPNAGTTFEQNRARVKELYEVGKFLSNRASVRQILKLVGPENSLFQISVTGFRKNDENGDSAYLSTSIGEENALVGPGAFASFAAEQKISTYEVRATYLGNGL